MEIGQRLLALKKGMPHGVWNRWVEEHLSFNVRTARRYIGLARAKGTTVSDLKNCGSLMKAYEEVGITKTDSDRKVALKLFSAPGKVLLSKPPEELAEEEKELITAEFELLEPIAQQLYPEPSIFNSIWRQKLSQPAVQCSRSDAELLKREVQKAKNYLREIEENEEIDKPQGHEEGSHGDEAAELTVDDAVPVAIKKKGKKPKRIRPVAMGAAL